MSLLTTTQAADALGIRPRQVRNLCAAGTIPATKTGRDYLIRATDLAQGRKRPRPGRRWPK